MAEKKKKFDELIKHISQIEKDISRQIHVRNLVKPVTFSISKTGEFFKESFVFVEQGMPVNFFFQWLPGKIKKYLKLIIPLLLMALVLYLPLDVEPEIKKAIALFIAISLLWAFESMSIVVTALLIPVLAVILGIMNTENPFASFSNPIIYLLLSGLVIAQAFRKHGLDKMIALKMLSWSEGNIRKLLFYTMLITALLGMWMSNTATIALMAPVILSVSLEISRNAQKNYTGMLLLSSGFASSIGGLATILGGSPNAITAAFLREIAEFNFFDWVVIGFPLSIVLFIATYIVFLRLYNVGNETINIKEIVSEARSTRFTRDQKKTLAIFFPTVLLWLFGSRILNFFPPEFYRTEIIGLAAAILLFAFHVLEWDDVRKIPWEIFLIVGGGLTLGHILIDTGSAGFLADHLFSLVAFLPNIIVIMIIIAISMVLANFVNNASATIIMVPVLISLAPMLGVNHVILAMAAAMATAVASLTPIAMPSFSLIYGTGEVTRREMIRTGFFVALACGPIMAGLLYLIGFFI
jgi:solute carrier family 13 (sodium-dependent dicarboxylate transporter), member 2/3/5